MQNQIRTIREKKGLSQHQLAELADTTSAQISRLESGRRRLDMDWIEKLAQAMDVTTAQIMGLAPLDFIDDIQMDVSTEACVLRVSGYVEPGGRVCAAEPGALEAFRPAGAVFDGRNLSALRVNAPIWGGTLPENSVLFYETRVFGVPSEFLGELCIVKLAHVAKKTEDVRVGRVFPGKKIGVYRLEALDAVPQAEEEHSIEWSARVRWIQFPQD
jgi:transcriptional regulator with XRE-family HTH domain